MMAWALQSLVATGVVFAVIVLGLIISDRPSAMANGTGGLDFSAVQGAEIAMPEPRKLAMRDGFDMTVWDYPNDIGPLVVMIHGSGWNGRQFKGLASALQGHARVLVPSLRGHGRSPGRRGDVDYIGQLEDDLKDLIAA
ncbi:MAG: hypothetical protein ACI8R4_004335, partial [Paracoccaceae bacterium]